MPYKLKKSLITAALLSAGLASTAYAAVPALTVENGQILSGGEQKSFAGNSFFWSNSGWGQEKMYNADVVAWLKNDWQTSIVRVALGADEGGSYLDDPAGNLARITTVVDAAIANDLYVIIDFHSHHAEDKKAAAIKFFTEMAQRYGSYNNVIYEIYNEPLPTSWSNVIKPYAVDVINAIRSIDPDNLIVVGTPTWSQDVDVASQDPINATNIAYAFHFYAGTHGQSLRNKALTAMNNGIALMVTEWGAVNADGNGNVAEASVNEWMNFLASNNLTHLNWAVSDKNEGASIIKPGVNPRGNWRDEDLTASGTLVKQIIANWGTAIDSTDDGEDSPTPTPSEPTTPPTGEPQPATDVTANCEHVITNRWSGGFQGAIRISNNSDNPLNGWQVHWNYSDGTVISQSWGANLSGNYSASNVDWNGTIAPHTTVEMGFIANGEGNASAVTGDVCQLAAAGNNNADDTGSDGTEPGDAGTGDDSSDNGNGNSGGTGGADNNGGGNEAEPTEPEPTEPEVTEPEITAPEAPQNPSGVASCQYQVTNRWQGGFQAAVKITNLSASPINGWQVSWHYDNGSTVTNLWNAALSDNYSASNLGWNATIAPNQTVEFGFTGTGSGDTESLSGEICQ
ncbi:cellulase family glycosylhydrolase [Shewanella avicenniae]|uniref:Endoglucanase n=1 Tax=Shewanella avicenniae TaxID=2814294 RepID=A0ABX7QLI0_9GAMM|nr:cellulase family glycosylhydrolase [Shewanella avicenniae]QSX32313.1 cellulase family glycosylhydrolase [Shewanella avicenniae]